jgi:hypothetical protein
LKYVKKHPESLQILDAFNFVVRFWLRDRVVKAEAGLREEQGQGACSSGVNGDVETEADCFDVC